MQTSGGQSSVSGDPDDNYLGLGISKKTFMYLVGGVIGLILLVVILVLLLNGNGKVTKAPTSSGPQITQQFDRGNLS